MSHLRYTPAGSSLVNKSRTLRPCGRGRRFKSPKSTPPSRDIPLPFLKLPAEVRNQIYGYLLTFKNDLILMDHQHAANVRNCGKSNVGRPRNHVKGTLESSWDNEGNSIIVESELVLSYKQKELSFIDQSLLLVNKQIYNEARGVLLSSNTLKFNFIDLDAMKPARWETMRHCTRFNIGMFEESMPTMVDLLCSTHYDLLDLQITMIIPGSKRTRCQYWVEQTKEMLEPLRDLHVRGQVIVSWIERHLVDNPEVRRETVEWLEKLGTDMMGGPGDGKPLVIGEEADRLAEAALAAYQASAMAAAIAASLTTSPPVPALASTPASSATVSTTLAIAAPIVSTQPATPPTVTLPAVPTLEDDTDDDMES